MLVKPISAVPASDSVDPVWLRTLVTSVLTAQEVAVALVASDMPTRRVALSSEQEIAYAVQGVARLGVDEVRDRARQARNVNGRYCELLEMNGGQVAPGNLIVKALNARERQVWGCGQRRQDRAVSVAWNVTGLSARLAPVVLLEGAAAVAEMSGEVAGWTPGGGKAVPARPAASCPRR